MILNTNILALTAHRNIKSVSSDISTSSVRLSSGLKINSAADDASGMAIAKGMTAQVRSLMMAEKNVQDGVSMIQVADGGLTEVNSMLHRIRELSVQAANDTNTTDDRKKLQQECDQLKQEIDMLADRTTFNTLPLLSRGGTTIIGYDKVIIYDETDIDDLRMYQQLIGEKRDIVLDNTQKIENLHIAYNGLVSLGEPHPTKDEIIQYSTNLSTYTKTASDACYVIDSNLQEALIKYPKLTTNSEYTSLQQFINDHINYSHYVLGYLNPVMNNSANAKAQAEANNITGARSSLSSALSTASGGGINFCHLAVANSAYTIINYLTPETALDGKEVEIPIYEGGYFIQNGANANQLIRLGLPVVISAKALTLDKLTLLSAKDAGDSLSNLDGALDRVNGIRAFIGSQQNCLQFNGDSLAVASENISTALSRIQDADMAKEIMHKLKSEALMNASTSVLTQANQSQNRVLDLLK